MVPVDPLDSLLPASPPLTFRSNKSGGRILVFSCGPPPPGLHDTTTSSRLAARPPHNHSLHPPFRTPRSSLSSRPDPFLPFPPPQEIATTHSTVRLVCMDSSMDTSAYDRAFGAALGSPHDAVGAVSEGEEPFRRAPFLSLSLPRFPQVRPVAPSPPTHGFRSLRRVGPAPSPLGRAFPLRTR